MKREIRIASCLLTWVVLLAGSSGTDDLAEQYPATLDYSEQRRGYDWTSTEDDVWRLKEFRFGVGEKFSLQVGPSQVVFGRHQTNVLCAAVFPNEPGEIARASAGQGERVTSVWLRFHPARVGELFPAATVLGQGDAATIQQAKRLAEHKLRSSWHVGGQPMVPFKSSIIIDVETAGGPRRFYSIDTAKATAEYHDAFRTRPVARAKAIDRDVALAIFDKVWDAFDREYAMFVVKPKVDWQKLRGDDRPRAAAAADNHALARILSEMLTHLEDLHVYVQVDGSLVPGYQRDRPLNASRSAVKHLIGTVTDTGHELSWARTGDGIGYIAIDRLTDSELPRVFDEVLEQMKDTRGLIIDLRFNGGGSELLGRRSWAVSSTARGSTRCTNIAAVRSTPI